MSEAVLIALIAGFTSGGISQLIIFLIKRKDEKKNDPLANIVRGISHDRIIFLANQYIGKGSISADEYENLYNYLYKSYKDLGGNGTVDRVMKDIEKLPIK